MIMSSTMVKWGGAAGIAAAGLLILSALLNQLSPGEGIVDTPSEYLYRGVVVLAYVGVIIAVLGIHSLHAGNSRYGTVGTAGSVITIAGYTIIAVITLISMIRDFEYLLTVRIGAAGLVLIGVTATRRDHHPCQAAALVVRRAAHHRVPAG